MKAIKWCSSPIRESFNPEPILPPATDIKVPLPLIVQPTHPEVTFSMWNMEVIPEVMRIKDRDSCTSHSLPQQ